MSARSNKAVGRLLNQFSDVDNWDSILTAFAARLDDTDIVLEGLLLYRTLDTAEGVWLDNVGVIVGYPRPPKEVADAGIFTLKAIGESDVPAQGLSSLFLLDGGVLTSLDGLPLDELATDTTYRKYLKGKILVTYSDSTPADVYTFVNSVFTIGCSVTSPAVGEVEIEIDSALTGAERRIVDLLAPRSAGISLIISNWP